MIALARTRQTLPRFIHAIVPLTAVGVIGMEESDLGDAGRRAAAAQSIGADAETEALQCL